MHVEGGDLEFDALGVPQQEVALLPGRRATAGTVGLVERMSSMPTPIARRQASA